MFWQLWPTCSWHAINYCLQAEQGVGLPIGHWSRQKGRQHQAEISINRLISASGLANLFKSFVWTLLGLARASLPRASQDWHDQASVTSSQQPSTTQAWGSKTGQNNIE
jgi:hypothetical protein